jgi:hypothetical protein
MVPSATYSFMSRGYAPPERKRAIGWDDVQNANGHFRYVYDNGPSGKSWKTFELVTNDNFTNLLGASATQQFLNILNLWDYTGPMGMSAPDGIHEVHWGQASLLPKFETMPGSAGDKIDYSVAVQFEEA